MFLFEQSRELPQGDKPRTGSKQAKVSLAPLNSVGPLSAALLDADPDEDGAPE
jgi:hypothetical protein